MKKFVVLYHMNERAVKEAATATKEEKDATMGPWMRWAKKCGVQLIDFGTPLTGGIKINANGSSSPSKRGVFGYSIIEAESLQAAQALMDGHPHLDWSDGCDLEIHESMPVPSA